MKLKIVVPTYNTESWIERCLRSIATQEYPDWECIVINDASTDRTWDVISSLNFVKNDNRFTIVNNDVNVKALKNIVDGFAALKAQEDPESILMVVDGDDFLFSEWSLSIVAQAYNQIPQLLLTYGNWVGYPDGTRSNCSGYSPEVIQQNLFRDVPFSASHLRTFKSKLWYKIKDKDLRDDEGNYFEAGWDVAFMMPMLEMARERHVFLDHVLYCYNRFNPISDFKIRETSQLNAVDVVKRREKYERQEF